MTMFWRVQLPIFACLALVSGVAALAGPGEEPGKAARIVIGPNLRASANATEGGRNECWITASPTNPKLLIAASHASQGRGAGPSGPRRCATMISRNGGQTWRDITLPKEDEGCFDPMTAAAADGRMYLLHTMSGRNFGEALGRSSPRRKGTIRIYSTEDQGRSWNDPVELDCPLAPDHPRMVVDNSGGPHHGRLYVVWNEVSDTFIKQKYHLFMHYSGDGGKTFSDPILLHDEEGGKLVATEPVVLSDGTLLVTYYQYYWPLSDKKNDRQPFYILRSSDGGETFGKPEKVIEVGSSAWRHLRGDFGRAFTLPIVVADTSESSPYRDRMYMVWDDVSKDESNIWLTWSADMGRTWSEPLRLNDNLHTPGGPSDFRMTPVVAVNQEGVVGVAWYDRRNDPARRCWEQYFGASLDGGETFLPNVAVSTAPSCPEKDLPPSVHVWNVSPYFDDTLPSEEELSKAPDRERRRMEEVVGIERAFREASKDIQAARIRVSFDPGRNIWPGHYTGLTHDAEGVFHALWADRRNELQQLFTARIQVLTSPEPSPPPTHTAMVTELVRLVGGPAKYEEAKGTATFELQVRNVSEQTIYAPLKVRVTKVASSSAGPTAIFLDPDEGGKGAGASWDFSELLGSRKRLEPLMISEAKKITVQTQRETGLDGVFDFEVIGHLTRAGQTSAGESGKKN